MRQVLFFSFQFFFHTDIATQHHKIDIKLAISSAPSSISQPLQRCCIQDTFFFFLFSIFFLHFVVLLHHALADIKHAHGLKGADGYFAALLHQLAGYGIQALGDAGHIALKERKNMNKIYNEYVSVWKSIPSWQQALNTSVKFRNATHNNTQHTIMQANLLPAGRTECCRAPWRSLY